MNPWIYSRVFLYLDKYKEQHMMRFIFLAILSILIFTKSYSQTFELDFSKDIKVKNRYAIKGFVNSDNLILGPFVDGKKFSNKLISSDTKGNLKEFDIEFPKEKGTQPKFISVDDKILSFCYIKDKKKRALDLYCNFYNDRGSIKTSKVIYTVTYADYEDEPLLRVSLSDNKDYVLVLNIFDNNDKKKDLIINGLVFDKDINQLSKFTHKKDKNRSQKLNGLNDFDISNEGIVHMLMMEYNDKLKDEVKKNGVKVPNYFYTLYSYNLDGTHSHDDILFKDYFPIHTALFLNADQEPNVIMDLREKPNSQELCIGFQTLIKKNDGILTKHRYMFDQSDFSAMGMVDKYNSKFFEFGNFLILDDAIHFVYQSVFFVTKRSGEMIYRERVSGSSVVFDLTNDGEIVDYTFIPKFNVTGVNGRSCKLMPYRNSYAMLYIDRTKNLERDLSEFRKYSSKMVLSKKTSKVLAYRNENNVLERKELKKLKDYYLYLHNYSLDKDGTVTLAAKDGKKLSFISFKGS